MDEWNRTCQPPWTEKELRHKLDDADKKPGERGYLLRGPSGAGRQSPPLGNGSDFDEKKSQSTQLVELAEADELWHTGGQTEAYATLLINDHAEHCPIRSSTYRQRLAHRFYMRYGKAPGNQALTDALSVIAGRAMFDGTEHPVFVRVADHDGRVYLDLANTTWQVVEIDADGWSIIDSKDCPVRFRRPKGMGALPTPIAGGDIGELRRFVNVDDAGWALLLGWLMAALRPRGPYPLLALHGEQGSAKSTTARVVRAIIDPNMASLRSEPRNPRDLMIAAKNGWVIGLDNLSGVSGWLSDALCRLATGGGFGTRTLYQDDEETIFDAMRPGILTGIEEVANRSDLLDRCLILQLPVIPQDKRRTEEEFWGDFAQAHGRILGAVLHAVSVALRNLPSTRLELLPRMADFALWATAAESGLGLRSGEFLAAYAGNRDTANEAALESSPLAKYVVQLAKSGGWHGTSSELLVHIDSIGSDGDKRLKTLPGGHGNCPAS